MTTAGCAVKGIGIQPFRRHGDVSLATLSAAAINDALASAGVAASDVEEMFVGNGMGAPGTVARLAQELGITGIPVTRIEQSCASGSTALRFGCDAVESGRRRTVLVLGVDKMNPGLLELGEADTYATLLALNLQPIRYGLKAAQYLHATGQPPSALAQVSVLAKAAATQAPHAGYPGTFTVKEILESAPIADPLTKLQCCGNIDGAAAVILQPSSREPGEVRILSYVSGSTMPDPGTQPEIGWDNLERTVAQLAGALYKETGLVPGDFDVLQVNDAFSVAAPLYLEALGFASPGEGIELFLSGRTLPTGELPTNTDGGLLGRGHCLGATGLAMLFEIWLQLMGRAGPRQVQPVPRRALLQSHGLGGDNLFAIGT